jgi:undecaprenyl-diphosphatase
VSRWHGIAVLVLAILFVTLAIWVRGGNALAFDQAVHRAVRPDDDAGPLRFALIGRDMGTYAVIAGALPVLWFVRRRAWLAAAGVIGCEIGAFALNYLLKGLVARTRPAPDDIVTRPSGYLFPSTHTVMTVVCYGLAAFFICAVAPRWRALALAVYAGIVGYAGFCLIYLDTHYSTDVLAGILVGGGWLILSLRALVLLYAADTRRRPAQADRRAPVSPALTPRDRPRDRAHRQAGGSK